MKVLIGGAGGFIGGHLVDNLISEGVEVRAVDIKPFDQWFHINTQAHNQVVDLKDPVQTDVAANSNFDWIFNLAADMGGMGYIETHKANCMLSVLINTNLLQSAKKYNIPNFFFSSSACVYNADKQSTTDIEPLREEDAYPAMPEDGYGWEKLFSERMCRHFMEDFDINTRVARFHNVYGPRTSYDNLRGKAPATLSRKVIEAVQSGTNEIEIWGDGHQTRSFMYIDDCITGIKKIAFGDYKEPVNLGSAEMVSINQLVDMIEDIAEVKLNRTYNLDAPKGVRGRSSDNTLINALYGWEPSTSLREGLEKTYEWIYNEVKNAIPSTHKPSKKKGC